MRHEPDHKRIRDNMVSDFAMMSRLDVEPFSDCKDGRLTAHDIAKAARTGTKAAIRAISRYVEDADNGRAVGGGSVMSMSGVPDPKTLTRREMAVFVAERIGLIKPKPQRDARAGRAVPIRKLAALSEQTGRSIEELRPGITEAELMMARGHAKGHLYRDGEKGRGLTTKQEPGSGHVMIATLACQQPRCLNVGQVRLRDLPGPEIVDRKFKQQGWDIEPHKCPSCKTRKQEDKMAQQPTPAAVKAQGRMYGLLTTYFDAENGVYGGGYSDAKIAEEAGVAPELVVAVREEAFGELKEPPEIAQLSRDIEALAGLIDEAVAPIKTELGQLRARLGDLRRKFAA